MPEFGANSQKALASADLRLRVVFHGVVKHFDCSIIEGHRDRETQNRYFNEGKSKAKWGKSAHNRSPSLAVDAVPYPSGWDDEKMLARFAGYVQGVASMHSIHITWGGDFRSIHDPAHFEITGWRDEENIKSRRSM